MTKPLEALINRAKHIVENGGLLARDTSLQLIAALEQSQEESNTQLKTIASVTELWNDGRLHIAELESQNLTTSNALLDAGKRVAGMEARQPLEEFASKIADCDPEVYEKGVSACLVAIPKEVAEVICRGISAASGCKVDWHYIGGRVHIKAIRAAGGTVGGE